MTERRKEIEERRRKERDREGIDEEGQRYHYVERFRRTRQAGRGTGEGGGGGREYGTLEGKGLVVVVRVRGTV